MTNVTPARPGNQGKSTGPRIGLPAQTLFTPSRDQAKVKHLRVFIKHVAKPSNSVAHLYVSCGNIGFPIAVHAPEIPDIFVGTEWIAEYPADGNPLDGNFTAIYPASMKPEPQKEKPMIDIVVANDGLSMTSLEIAELVESRHDKVRQSIERLANRGVITLPPLGEKPTAGRPAQFYTFAGEQGKRDSIIVVAQLSPEFTAKLVDRWQELEKQLAGQQPAAPAIPQTLPEALRLAADLAEEKAKVEAERDEAIRTKAMIGSRREATAMASAAKARREAARLRDELGRNSRHATIIAVEKALGTKFPRNAYVALRRWCKENGIPPAEVADDRYGLVKAWPAGAWLECHDIDLAELFGSDCLDLVIANQAERMEARV